MTTPDPTPAPAADLAATDAPAPPLNNYALGRIRVDLTAGPEVEISLPAGTRIVHSYTAYESAPILIARPGAQPRMQPVPMLVVLLDPRRPVVKRRFVAIRVGTGVETDAMLEPIATFGDGTGEMFVLFEHVETPCAACRVREGIGPCEEHAAAAAREDAEPEVQHCTDCGWSGVDVHSCEVAQQRALESDGGS